MQNENCHFASGSSSSSPVGRQQIGKVRGNAARNYRKAHSVSPQGMSFASPQFCSSPSARSIPPPPSTWINKNCDPMSRPSSSSSSDSSSPISSSQQRDESMIGVRINPLQLIASVASG